jgi:hypothetical protein
MKRINRLPSLLAAMAIAGALAAGCAGPPPRPDRPLAELMAVRQANDAAREKATDELVTMLVDRARAKAAAAARDPRKAPSTMDMLIISGGGDWGAFGAGVLKGWGRVAGELARPQFDVVTGVSTGAMIAPFAFLGDDESIERIVRLYRNPQPDWATSRGMLFFLPNNPSFYALPGLEREMRAALDDRMLERIASENETGRALLVNTTNIDLGDMQVWNIVAEARRALANHDSEHVHRILLASAGIPAVFPARGISEYLYVDGAITGNILYGGRVRDEGSLLEQWRTTFPKSPIPRFRYWVIFNNQFRFPPQVTQDRWPEVMSRATIMATQTSTMNSIRHLHAKAEVARLKYGADVQIRVMAVPEDWVPPKPGNFQREVMNELADLGEKMGADPSSWRTEAP